MGSKRQTRLKKKELIVDSDSVESDEIVEQEEEYIVEKVLDVKVEKVRKYFWKLLINKFLKFSFLLNIKFLIYKQKSF